MAGKGGARCCGGCLASVPLLQLLCTLVILAGTIVYSVKGGAAFAAVRALFDKLSVSAPAQAKAAAASSGLLGAGIAVLLCMLALSTIATIAAAMGKRRRHAIRNGGAVPTKTCGACCEVGSNALVLALLWLFLALTVALIALWTAFFLGAFAGDHGASLALGSTDELQKRLAGALNRANGLFTKMRGAWEGLLARTPSLLANSAWFKDLTKDIGGPIMDGAKGVDEVTCPPACLDLGAFAAMMAFEPRCVCSQQMLTDVKASMRTSWTGAVAALAGLAAAAVAGSVALMAAVAALINSRRDLQDIKRAAAAGGAGGGGGAGGSAAGDGAGLALADDVEKAAVPAPDQVMAK